MGLTDEMQSLRDNIDAAQADRTKCIAEIGKETAKMRKDNKEMLSQFRREHKEMAGVLRRDLEASVTTVRADVVKVRKETKVLLADAKTLMKGYAAELDGMHDAWVAKAGGETRKAQKKAEAKKTEAEAKEHQS